jgi:hypothetical protein
LELVRSKQVLVRKLVRKQVLVHIQVHKLELARSKKPCVRGA